jgi:exonuclease SbcD
MRFLFLADTHLGFDLPQRPRIARRRRGHDFFANFQRALDVAVEQQVDFVVHGGDLLFRSRVPPNLVQQAFLPLKRVADTGIPVFLVPGNHERSKIPHSMLAVHPSIHIFDAPRTFVADIKGTKLALAGFPYCRQDVRRRFGDLLEQTGWRDHRAAVNLLCVHHCFEGATVGPNDYTFRTATDVIRGGDIPPGFAAVLSGHIHRHQVLSTDLRGRSLAAPVMYPGSVERTSLAEKDEAKGYLLIEVQPDRPGGSLRHWEFLELPARPMVSRELEAGNQTGAMLESAVRRIVGSLPADAILQLRVRGEPGPDQSAALSQSRLRALAPSSMNVQCVFVDERRRRHREVSGAAGGGVRQ